MLNKEWSEANKLIQILIQKEATFNEGIATLVAASIRIEEKLHKR